MNFEELFISEEKPYKGKSQRDKFLSRIFGIINEEIIRIWCKNEKSRFEDLGRPTIYDVDGRHYTLDFLLKDKETDDLFVAEMKCEIEYQKYKYFKLICCKQLEHHRKKRAFELFLELADKPGDYVVKCKGKEESVSGSVLVWGCISENGISEVKNDYSLSHVLSTEKIVEELVDWQDPAFIEFINQYKKWSNQLFNGLLGNDFA